MIKRDYKLGSVIKERRQALGLSQKEVASRAGIQYQQYQKLETDERNIMKSSFYIACRVIEALEWNVSDFFNEYKDKTVDKE